MIAALTRNPVLVAGAALALVAVVYLTRRGGDGGAGDTFGRQLGRGIARTVEDLAVGTVEGVGEMVGVPRTDPDRCAQALADGRLWDASFDCPALTFARGLLGIKPNAPVLDAPVGGGGMSRGAGAAGDW